MAALEQHQQEALKDLRKAAYKRSAFYRRHHAGLFDAPLDQLPPVTKADLMFSAIATSSASTPALGGGERAHVFFRG